MQFAPRRELISKAIENKRAGARKRRPFFVVEILRPAPGIALFAVLLRVAVLLRGLQGEMRTLDHVVVDIV